MDYSIVIPCYNEADNLEKLVLKLLPIAESRDVEFVLVENGSKDKSREWFENAKIFSHERFLKCYVDVNQGYGYGIQQGLKLCSGKYVGWIHADLQIEPEELIKAFDFLDNKSLGEHYFVKGRRCSRVINERIFTAGMSCIMSLIFRMKLRDINAVPVLFNKELYSQYFSCAPYTLDFDLFAYYAAKRNQYIEYRYDVYYADREKGVSSWNNGLSSKIKASLLLIKCALKIKERERCRYGN